MGYLDLFYTSQWMFTELLWDLIFEHSFLSLGESVLGNKALHSSSYRTAQTYSLTSS